MRAAVTFSGEPALTRRSSERRSPLVFFSEIWVRAQ